MLNLIAAGSILIAGIVSDVRDADTIVVDRQPIRIEGIAAPELHERWGRDGQRWLARLIQGRRIECRSDGTRSHDRLVAACTFNGRDLGAQIVEAQWARDCRRFSGGRYAELERGRAAVLPLPRYCRR